MLKLPRNTFAIATISIATIGLVVALLASAIGNFLYPTTFLKYSWCGNVFQLAVLLSYSYCSYKKILDSIRHSLLSLLSAALVTSTLVVNSQLDLYQRSFQAVATGHLLLCIVNICWIYSLGSSAESQGKDWLKRSDPSRDTSSHFSYSRGLQEQVTMTKIAPSRVPPASGPTISQPIQLPASTSVKEEDGDRPVTAFSLEYPYRAKAIYSYDANQEDPNELSFVKGEVFEVSDTSGKWWLVRKADGSIGIIPSNYVTFT